MHAGIGCDFLHGDTLGSCPSRDSSPAVNYYFLRGLYVERRMQSKCIHMMLDTYYP